MEIPQIEKSDMPVRLYRLYGVTMASRYLFKNRIGTGTGRPDITFTCFQGPPGSCNWSRMKPAYASQSVTKDGEPMMAIYCMDGYDVIHFADTAVFFLSPVDISAYVLNPSHEYLIEIQLLGPVFSIWLELSGIATIHASSVAVENRAAGFLSTNKGGKTSLAGTLMQAGCRLLSDDILPIEYRGGAYICRPSFPQMRMWPELAEHFLGTSEELEIAHPRYTKRRVPVGPGGFGTFCNEDTPLKVLYVPKRGDAIEHIVISPINPRDSLFELIRNSFSARIVEDLGLQKRRMNFFADLVIKIPIRRIEYPSGLEHLPEVRDAIIDDILSL